jgi:hypothetical protein
MAAVVFLMGILRGGGAQCIKHFILRWHLQRNGALPWNYPQFLDYAAERILLRKVGGGYIFVCRPLLDYFVDLKGSQEIRTALAEQDLSTTSQPAKTLQERFAFISSLTHTFQQAVQKGQEPSNDQNTSHITPKEASTSPSPRSTKDTPIASKGDSHFTSLNNPATPTDTEGGYSD